MRAAGSRAPERTPVMDASLLPLERRSEEDSRNARVLEMIRQTEAFLKGYTEGQPQLHAHLLRCRARVSGSMIRVAEKGDRNAKA